MSQLKQQLEALILELQATENEDELININQQMLLLLKDAIMNQYATINYYETVINVNELNLNDETVLLGIIGMIAETNENFANEIRPVFFECDEMEFWGLMRELVTDSGLVKG